MNRSHFLDVLRAKVRDQGAPIVQEYQDSDRWTKAMTRALVATGQALMPEGRAIAKDHADDWGRSEYLTLDLVVLDSTRWGPPLLVAEHENSPHADRIRYDAWKLFAVSACERVLVAYFGGRHVKTREDLVDVVREVARDNLERPLLLVSGDYNLRPTTMNDVIQSYKLHTFGTGTA